MPIPMSGLTVYQELQVWRERAEEAEKVIAWQRAELARKTVALAAAQWGSCDGCGQKNTCPECGADKLGRFGSDGVHGPECIIGNALRPTSALPEEP